MSWLSNGRYDYDDDYGYGSGTGDDISWPGKQLGRCAICGDQTAGHMDFVWTGYESDEEKSRVYRVKESKPGHFFTDHLADYAACGPRCANTLIEKLNRKSNKEREQNMTQEEKDIRAKEKEILDVSATKIRYRITGPQSIQRLTPLLHSLRGVSCIAATDVLLTSAANVNHGSSVDKLDFVWETACKITERQQHLDATVLNRLHNSQIIEDKSNLAFLQLSMTDCPRRLTTYVAKGVADVRIWAEKQWSLPSSSSSSSVSAASVSVAASAAAPPLSFLSLPLLPLSSLHGVLQTDHVDMLKSLVDECVEPLGIDADAYQYSCSEESSSSTNDWWFVKASKGNGGRDIWIINENNYESTLANIASSTNNNDEFVIQQYAPDPLLWHGKKFHFRVYAGMKADMTAYVYQEAFALTAGLDHDDDDSNEEDLSKHISNLSVNKHIDGHPGQIPIDLLEQFPPLFEKIKTIWASVVAAAAPFMSNQRSPHHFEFFGLDIVADRHGECWLIEANRLPGLESSNNNKKDEDDMYNEMMDSWLRIVVRPLIHKHHHHQDHGLHPQSSSSDNQINDTDDQNHHPKKRDRTERSQEELMHPSNDESDNHDSSVVADTDTDTLDVPQDPPVKRMCQDSTSSSSSSSSSTISGDKKKKKKVLTLESVKADILEFYEDEGMWVQVNQAFSTKEETTTVTYDPASVWKNLFAWKAYTRKRRHLVMVNNS